FKHNIAQHLDGKGHPRAEEREARRDYKQELKGRRQTDRAREDTGYRLLTSRLAAKQTPACPHATMGPRAYTIFGWDPQLTRVCRGCQLPHLDAIDRKS